MERLIREAALELAKATLEEKQYQYDKVTKRARPKPKSMRLRQKSMRHSRNSILPTDRTIQWCGNAIGNQGE
jgi:hypothetical protein